MSEETIERLRDKLKSAEARIAVLEETVLHQDGEAITRESRIAELQAAVHEFNRACEDGVCDQCRETSRLLEPKP